MYILRRQAVFFLSFYPVFQSRKIPTETCTSVVDLFDRICILNEKTDLQVFYTRNERGRKSSHERARSNITVINVYKTTLANIVLPV